MHSSIVSQVRAESCRILGFMVLPPRANALHWCFPYPDDVNANRLAFKKAELLFVYLP
jgi:hypothetical protein